MKNKFSYVGISFIVLIFGIWTVKELRSRYGKPKLELIGKMPSFQFTDQNDKPFSSNNMKGKVYVVEFFFASCPGICPKMNKNMLQLQDAYYGNLDFGIASITIDPENDTPEALKVHAKAIGVKHPNWYFLSGDYDKTIALSSKGFNLYAGKNPKIPGGFEHSGLFALIDKEGNIRSRKDAYNNPIVYYDGLSQSGINMLKEDIQLLLEE